MIKLLRKLLRRLYRQRVYRIERLPVGLELSDGDYAALYGWPDCRVEEVRHEDS